MAKPLSEDLKVRVIEAVEGGMSRRAAAERFVISSASAVRIVREAQQRRSSRFETISSRVLFRDEHFAATTSRCTIAG